MGTLLQLLPQQDVILSLVSEQQLHLGLLQWVAQHVANDLQHRGDPGAASNHAKVLGSPGLLHLPRFSVLLGDDPVATVRVRAGWAAALNLGADLHVVKVLRERAAVREPRVHILEVDLEAEVEEPLVVDHGDRSVLPRNNLPVCRAIQLTSSTKACQSARWPLALGLGRKRGVRHHGRHEQIAIRCVTL